MRLTKRPKRRQLELSSSGRVDPQPVVRGYLAASQKRTFVHYRSPKNAILTDDMAPFSAVLMDDVRLEADGGGKAVSIPEPLHGRSAILDFCAQARKWWRDYDWTIVRLATGYGAALSNGFAVVAVIWLDSLDGRRVFQIYIMRNPEKLGALGVIAEGL